jgi:predicted patatin/cPLA2 family phospholipase
MSGSIKAQAGPSDDGRGPSGAGLVLEGGGMRAAYTAGALDAFMDQEIDLRYVVGVSAGANAGSDYAAGQRERNHRVFVDMAADPRYAGLGNLLRERSWFGMRFLFETLPDELAPFKYEEFRRSPRTLVVGLTDCATGEPAYLTQHGYEGRWFVRTVLRASSSLPVLSPPVTIEGRRYTDGGVSDPIPIARAIADGNPRNVVVLTQNAGYRKGPQGLGVLASVGLARYPALRRTLRERHEHYNSCLDRLAELEQEGRAFVLRPVDPLMVGRMERDVGRLDALYRQGYRETLARGAELKGWLAAGSGAR